MVRYRVRVASREHVRFGVNGRFAQFSSVVALTFVSVIVLLGSPARAQNEAATVNQLLRDLKAADYETADSAARAVWTLRDRPRFKAQIVPALIEALKTREWNRCSGDMRDSIARLLIEFKARDAVPALLDLAASSKTIDHECAE